MNVPAKSVQGGVLGWLGAALVRAMPTVRPIKQITAKSGFLIPRCANCKTLYIRLPSLVVVLCGDCFATSYRRNSRKELHVIFLLGPKAATCSALKSNVAPRPRLHPAGSLYC